MSDIIPILPSTDLAASTGSVTTEQIFQAHNDAVLAARGLVEAGKSLLEACLQCGIILQRKRDEIGNKAAFHSYLLNSLVPTISKAQAYRYLTLANSVSRVRLAMAENPSLSLRQCLALLAVDKHGSKPLEQLGLPLHPDEVEETPKADDVADEFEPETKVGRFHKSIIEWIESPKVTEDDYEDLLDLYEEVGEKLRERGLLTDEGKTAQQLPANAEVIEAEAA